jgi:hypothetical protein
MENSMKTPQKKKLKIELAFNPAISLLEKYPKECK